MLTEASGSNTIYQMDAGQNQSNLDTVVIMDGSRQETGLVKQILPPVYRGAIVVCQGEILGKPKQALRLLASRDAKRT